MKKIQVIFLAAFLALFTACSTGEFYDKKPYAVRVAQERNYHDASLICERLKAMSLPAYIVYEESKSQGKWFKVLVGAYKSLEDVMETKIDLEDKYAMNDIEIVNYNSMLENLQTFDPSVMPVNHINTDEPELTEELWDLIRIFPDNDMFFLEKISLFVPLQNLDILTFEPIKHIATDLPRGINFSEMLAQSSGFAEVHLKDNIYGHITKINIFRLRKNHNFNTNIAEQLADKILATKDYAFEEKNPMTISAFRKLRGFKAAVATRKDDTKHFVVLTDEKLQYIIFCESDHLKHDDLDGVMKLIGEGDGLSNYNEFCNSFYTLPVKQVDDKLIYYHLQKIDIEGASKRKHKTWQKEARGNWSSYCLFFNQSRGIWEYKIYDLQDDKRAEEAFKAVFPAEKDTLNVFGKTAYISTLKREDITTKQLRDFPNEVYFQNNRFICIFSNDNRALLTREDMGIKIRSFQLSDKIFKDGWF